MNYKEFSVQLRKANTKKSCKVNNSFRIKDIWRWVKKNKWFDLGQSITELQMGTIVKRINQYYQDRLLKGYTVKFPCGMGELYLVKYQIKPYYKDGKLKIPIPIDWKSTIDMWYEDEETYKNKLVTRYNIREIYKVCYSTRKAAYKNKTFMKFVTSRTLKNKIKEMVKQGFMPFN